jgi:ribonuclease PH
VEDSGADVDANFVMTGDGAVIEIQATAEANPFSRQQLNEMLDLANDGIAELVSLQRAALGIAD